ncbi:MAG: heat-inducible transcriptional repressor HrcA, partial [Acidimicrobiia bacterium]
MDQRKAAILEAVVDQYVRTGQPVGSQAIARAGDLGISAATVRNELMFLEREGYVTHPHTSAGRVPTDLGYRFFVDNFAAPRELAPRARQAVADFFDKEHLELEEMLQATSRLLSQVTRCAAVVVAPPADVAVVRALQLVRLHSSLVLVVVVLSGGVIDKQLLEIGEDVDDGTISAASGALAAQFAQASLTDLPELAPTGDVRVDQLARQARDALAARVGVTDGGPVYV